jgi:hypothetical protein
MFPPEQIFVFDYDALTQIQQNPSAPNLLSASAILRRLLLDSSPVYHQANRSFGEKLVFEIASGGTDETVAALGGIPGLVSVTSNEGIDPSFLPHRPRKQVNLNGFLSTKIAFIEGVHHSVKDVIIYVANVGGGVHKGSPKATDQQGLESLSMQMHVGGVPAALRMLLGVISVALKAMEPLYRRIRA